MDTVVADEWAGAAAIRSEVQPAEEDVAEANGEDVAGADETRRVRICKHIRISCFIDYFVCDRGSVSFACYKKCAREKLEESTHDNGFETSYGVLTGTVCGD